MLIKKIIPIPKELNWEEAIRQALKDSSFKVYSVRLNKFQAILEGRPTL